MLPRRLCRYELDGAAGMLRPVGGARGLALFPRVDIKKHMSCLVGKALLLMTFYLCPKRNMAIVFYAGV